MSLGFISYSHLDNQPWGPDKECWVETFHRNLKVGIDKKRGRGSDHLWYDHRLTGNEDLTKGIRSALENSQFLLAIVSPSFLKSDYCPQELVEFLKSCDRRSLDDGGRVFKIVKEEVDRNILHPSLQAPLGYDFLDRSGRVATTFDTSTRKYWNLIEEIAHDFSAALAKHATKGTVCIPECPFDAIPYRVILRRELEARGYEVVSSVGADNLLTVHVIGKEQPEVPIRNALGECLVWITPGCPDSEFVKTLKESPKAGVEYELVEGLVDSIKAAVFERLEPKPKPAPKASTENLVYLICDSTQQEMARGILAELVRAKYSVVLPLFEGEPSEIRLEHEECIREADAALVLWQNVQSRGWLRAKIRELNKATGLRRERPLAVAAVLSEHNDDALVDGRIHLVRSVQGFLDLFPAGRQGTTA